MNHTFILKNIRMHMNKDGLIIFEGAFPHDNPENKTLHAFVNGAEVPIEIEKNDGLEVARKYNVYGCGISQEILGSFALPDGQIKRILLYSKHP